MPLLTATVVTSTQLFELSRRKCSTESRLDEQSKVVYSYSAHSPHRNSWRSQRRNFDVCEYLPYNVYNEKLFTMLHEGLGWWKEYRALTS